jgi:hypothetical protein
VNSFGRESERFTAEFRRRSGQTWLVSSVPGSASSCYRGEISNGLLCGIASRFQEAPGIFTGVSLLEYGATGDQDFGTGTHDVCDGVVMDAAVDFDAEAEPASLPDIREHLNFLQTRVNKGLTTEAWVYAHDQNVVDQGKNFIESVDRCGRVDDNSRLTSK